MAGNLMQLFPAESRSFWEQVIKDEAYLQEIRFWTRREAIQIFRTGPAVLQKRILCRFSGTFATTPCTPLKMS